MARFDKFNQPYELVACKDKKGTGYGVGYIEIGKQLYKVEPSPASGDKVDKYGNLITDWVKITKVKKRGGNAPKRGL